MPAVLGLSCWYHDSAAALVVDGRIVAAAQEERFTRRKHDARFPSHAAAYCLSEAGLTATDLDLVAFYDKPLLTFERLLETYLGYAPRGLAPFLQAMPRWLKQKLWVGDAVEKELGYTGTLAFPEHHESHAASAFYPSPFARAAFLTVDGVGEWATTTYGRGDGADLQILASLDFPHSLGLLYSAFTTFCGFKANSGEYKLMGLAPYGEPRYVQTILDHLIDLKPDGSYRLHPDRFTFQHAMRMTGDGFAELFGGPARGLEGPLTQREMDLARSVQVVVEEAVLRMARHVHRETGERALCLAGGVALNCVANGRLLREGPFDEIWVQPAAGDAGGALGAALTSYHQLLGGPRTVHPADAMQGSFLGPAYSDADCEQALADAGLPVRRLPAADLPGHVAALLDGGAAIGWFQGRAEFGPRALGHRSILADPRGTDVQRRVNLKVKFRESFRPFAPSVLAEHANTLFEMEDARGERRREPVHAARGACARRRDRGRRHGALAARPEQRPRRHPRRRLGARPDRHCQPEPAVPRAAPGVLRPHRLPGSRQHVVQRARRAHRRDARRRRALLSRHPPRRARARPVRGREGRRAGPRAAVGSGDRRRIWAGLILPFLRKTVPG